jgi:hypothetical protein
MNAFGGRGIFTFLEHLVLPATENNIIKVNAVKVPQHESVKRNGSIIPLIPNLGTKSQPVISFTPGQLPLPEVVTHVPVNRILSGPQNRIRQFREQKIYCLFAGN